VAVAVVVGVAALAMGADGARVAVCLVPKWAPETTVDVPEHVVETLPASSLSYRASTGTSARDAALSRLHRAMPSDPYSNIAGWPTWRALDPHIQQVSHHYPRAGDRATGTRSQPAGCVPSRLGRISACQRHVHQGVVYR